MRFFTLVLLTGWLLSAFTLLPNHLAPSVAQFSQLETQTAIASIDLVARTDGPKHRGSGRRELMEHASALIG